MKRNLKLGEWMIPVFRGLRAGKRLRGTSLDPFGRAQVRRVERELIGEYERRVRDALENLTPVTHPAVAELAELPDVIRGTRTSSSATWSATGHAPQSCAGGSPAARPSPPPRSGRSCRSRRCAAESGTARGSSTRPDLRAQPFVQPGAAFLAVTRAAAERRARCRARRRRPCPPRHEPQPSATTRVVGVEDGPRATGPPGPTGDAGSRSSSAPPRVRLPGCRGRPLGVSPGDGLVDDLALFDIQPLREARIVRERVRGGARALPA
jgi:hypothetical protein